MTRCPFCGARGVKLAHDYTLQEDRFESAYCGHCGRNWPDHLAHIASDGRAPENAPAPAAPSPARSARLSIAARVAQIAAMRRDPRDWKHDQAGDDAALEPVGGVR